jgi:hypothetical protein
MRNPRSRTLQSNKQEYATEGKSQESQETQGFVPKVQHHKGAYVSIEESTKDRISFNPKHPELPPRSNWFSTSPAPQLERSQALPAATSLHCLSCSPDRTRRMGVCAATIEGETRVGAPTLTPWPRWSSPQPLHRHELKPLTDSARKILGEDPLIS